MNSMLEQAQSGKPAATSDEATMVLVLEQRVAAQDAEITRLRSALARSESRAARLHARIAALGQDVEPELEPELQLELEPEPEPESKSVTQSTQVSVEEEGIPSCFETGAARSVLAPRAGYQASTDGSPLQPRELAVIDVTMIDAM
jgi:uncharacterized coiled-coil protein SlyX